MSSSLRFASWPLLLLAVPVVTTAAAPAAARPNVASLLSDNGHATEHSAGITVDDHHTGYPRGHYCLAHRGGGNTGKWIGHKSTFLEGGIRVPAILRHPTQVPPGQTRHQVVMIMNWFPTGLDLCGLRPETGAPRLDGRRLLPNLPDAEANAVRHSLHPLAEPSPEVQDHAVDRPALVQELRQLHAAWAAEGEAR
jgi:arylsulfatase A-like enzyme